MDEIASRYNPKETEDKWYKFWEEKNLFSARANPDKNPFSIVIPPPNVTGILHMGHALNNTIQDILIRYHRMKGEESLWMPGTDHAGIATQNVVEKSIAKEGLTRQDLGREKFIERVWQWKEKYGVTIIHQLKKLGASCDWSRTRFTMDEKYSQSVIEVFVRLYEKGLIYRGSYIINWCPRCQTALSDEEAPHRPINGSLYYIRYPLKEEIQNYIIVATTRPETMLGDTAVAVNPKDKRYHKFIGKTLILPLINREIKVIADTIVDMKFGTGAVKVTPAHDSNDYILGKKHNLNFINIMHTDAVLNSNAGDYEGMDRFKAREVILEDLKNKGLLEKVQAHELSAGHCYRCQTIIEPYLSKQWFVKMKPLSKPAIEAVKKGKIKFYPKRWTKVYLNWMENIQDWCISRQIWWGHRLPVYYCKNCQRQANGSTGSSQQSTDKTKSMDYGLCLPAGQAGTMDEKGIIVSRVKPGQCPLCGSTDIYQDEDVLDTWFSSWLWPFATFYWPLFSRQSVDCGLLTVDESDLNYFYPTSVLVTAPEIIFFWVARMIMAGLEFLKDIPFKNVYIHGTVRDIEGKKMSKSLGNIIDPLDIINEYGADALRFSLISITAQGQDVFLSKERFQQGRNFANKIWNAARLILMNLEQSNIKQDSSESADFINRWILSRFYSVLKEVNKTLDAFKFNEAANILYGFFWHEFCDWYLEMIKPKIKDRHNQIIMHMVLEKFLITLHPFMPFITEEIWQKMSKGAQSIMLKPWPHIEKQIIDKELEINMQSLLMIIKTIRNLRMQIELEPSQEIAVSIYPHHKTDFKLIRDNTDLIINLAKLETLNILDSNKRPESTISDVIENVDIYLHFQGLIEIGRERDKIKEKISKLEEMIKVKEARLKNTEFLKKAPAEIVKKEKESIIESQNTSQRLLRMFDELR